MDKMFDANHDGKLSDRERMDRDYFINEMGKDSANPKPTLPSYQHNQYNYIAAKWVGILLFAIGINVNFFYSEISQEYFIRFCSGCNRLKHA